MRGSVACVQLYFVGDAGPVILTLSGRAIYIPGECRSSLRSCSTRKRSSKKLPSNVQRPPSNRNGRIDVVDPRATGPREDALPAYMHGSCGGLAPSFADSGVCMTEMTDDTVFPNRFAV